MLAPSVIDEVKRLCERAYPREACGAVTRERHVIELKNRLPDPQAQTAFEMDPTGLLRVLTGPAPITHFFHSHCDAPPVLSAEDLRAFAPGGVELVANAALIVVSVVAGNAHNLECYQWDSSIHRYRSSEKRVEDIAPTSSSTL